MAEDHFSGSSRPGGEDPISDSFRGGATSAGSSGNESLRREIRDLEEKIPLEEEVRRLRRRLRDLDR